MKRNHRAELRTSRFTHGLLLGLALVGAFVLLRELPALRRYLRMERM